MTKSLIAFGLLTAVLVGLSASTALGFGTPPRGKTTSPVSGPTGPAPVTPVFFAGGSSVPPSSNPPTR